MLPTTLSELEALRLECRTLVRQRAGISAGAAVIPVPGMDMMADVVVFSTLLETISSRFGLSQAELAKLDHNTRKYILLTAGRAGSELIGKLVTKQLAKLILKKAGARLIGKTLLRFVPIAGQAVAAGISYGVVTRLGDAHIEDCYQVVRALLEQTKTPEGQP
ncbi:hypothetical protein [Chitinimonas sp.]|uniref:hypothetical protein n=1 Tax=Chitinimonas sp. TaxID=1934313 RepID=UPI002F923EF9